jgi:hypothetical protein
MSVVSNDGASFWTSKLEVMAILVEVAWVVGGSARMKEDSSFSTNFYLYLYSHPTRRDVPSINKPCHPSFEGS